MSCLACGSRDHEFHACPNRKGANEVTITRDTLDELRAAVIRLDLGAVSLELAARAMENEGHPASAEAFRVNATTLREAHARAVAALKSEGL